MTRVNKLPKKYQDQVNFKSTGNKTTLTIPGELPTMNKIINRAKGHWTKYRELKKDYDGLVSDRDIREEVVQADVIVPFQEDNLEPASYDLTLADAMLIQRPGQKLKIGDKIKSYKVGVEDYALKPGDFVLASTREKVYIPNHLAAEVTGKSTIARYGLKVRQTAGWIDPGFSGNITLEVVNDSENTIQLVPGMKIAQLVSHKLSSECETPYDGKYQNSEGVVSARTKKIEKVSPKVKEENKVDKSTGYDREINDSSCESGICPVR